MAVVMRLTRTGAKKAPTYRVVVADQRRARDGKFIEIIGTYEPLKETEQYNINTERAQVWLKNGAIPSDTVRDLLVKCGVLEKKN